MSAARKYGHESGHFAFREVDPEGEATLEVMSLAPRFNHWMFDTIRPFVAPPVLEIGSGIGNISRYLLRAGVPTALSDVRTRYCRHLHERFGGHRDCLGVHQLDLVSPDFARRHRALLGGFRTVFSLNVLEHIEDDQLALANARELLQPGGQLVILVPAFGLLYNRLDRELGHFRRYTRATLDRTFTASGLDVVQSFYFNVAGMPGWAVSGGLSRASTPSPTLVRLYNRLVGLFRVLDAVTFRRFGLSVVMVGRRPVALSLPAAA